MKHSTLLEIQLETGRKNNLSPYGRNWASGLWVTKNMALTVNPLKRSGIHCKTN